MVSELQRRLMERRERQELDRMLRAASEVVTAHADGGDRTVVARYTEPQAIARGGFSIKAPETWWEFDVRPESRDAAIRQTINDRVRARPELAPHRETFEAFLRKASKDAWQSGALYCGCMAERFGGDTPVTGSVTVSLVGARTPNGDVLPTDPDRIVAQLGVREAKREGDA